MTARSATPTPGHGAFVGRGAELHALDTALAEARAGHGQIALVIGEPGVGKTRTVEEFANRARDNGALVLWGRCNEWEGAPPYWPWIQIMRAYLRGRAAAEIAHACGPGAADIAQIMPELHTRLPGLVEPPPLEPEQARFRLFDSFTTALHTIADTQPLLLVLDDLHWADTPSLLLLRFLAQGVHDSSILAVGTYRNVEVGRHHPLAGILAELAREASTQRILLRGWSMDEVATYVAATAGRTPDPSLVSAVHDETEGNPFFVVEIVLLLAAEGQWAGTHASAPWRSHLPESIRDVIGRRLDRLSPECNTLLSYASVIGRDFSLPLLQRIVPTPPDALLDALDEALRAGIVNEDTGISQYRFSHALIQEALYQELSTAQRLRLHRQVAEQIEHIHAGDPQAHYDELARHYFEAAATGVADKAFQYATDAAARAMAHLAWESAAANYERALQVAQLQGAVDDRVAFDLALHSGRCQWYAGNMTEARPACLRATELARHMDDAERFAHAAIAYAGGIDGAMYLDPVAVRLLEEALALLPTGDSSLRAQLLSRLSMFLATDVDRMETTARDAVALAERLGDPVVHCRALIARWCSLTGPDGLTERAAVLRRMLAIAELIPRLHLVCLGHVLDAVDNYELGDFEAATASIARMDAANLQLRSVLYDHSAHLWVSALAMNRGDFEIARDAARTARRMGKGVAPFVEPAFLETELMIQREQDLMNLESEAVAYFLSPQNDDGVEAFIPLMIRCDLGLHEAAREVFQHGLQTERSGASRDQWWLIWAATLSEYCPSLGTSADAELLYRNLLPYAHPHVASMSVPWTSRGSAAHYLGLLATFLERYYDAIRHFEDAQVMNERLGARHLLAYTRRSHAEALLRRNQPGDREKAHTLLTQALATADALGMARLKRLAAPLIAQLAPAAHSEPNRESTPFGLSARELEVLRLLAAGRSDREIADALFISPRTASTHVGNILGKLGASSRTEAAALAVRLKLA